MFKYRLTFSKTGYAKYVSHLDLMRMFQRAFKRAELPIAYSNGFNPHQKISIAFPLPLGVTGTKEYMDVELTESLLFSELIERLNNALPTDIRILDAHIPEIKTSQIKWAAYSVDLELKHPISNLAQKIQNVLEQPTLIVDKKTKKGVAETDIRPMIHTVQIHQKSDIEVKLNLLLSCADGSNLKASTLIDALKKYLDGFEPDRININRDGLFLENQTEIF